MRHNASPDTAQLLGLPPLVYGGAFIMGLLLHLVFPLHILPTTLARGIGAVCVLVSLPLALATLRALSRAHTPVDPMKPTTALVTEGPFRYSRNPIYVALTLLYVGVALLINALWILLLVVPAVLVIRYGVIAREEVYLTRKFGDAYRQYTTQVRRWL
jgi:protein-S-isoprenylcysteine O-methyltransferase Ste14